MEQDYPYFVSIEQHKKDGQSELLKIDGGKIT